MTIKVGINGFGRMGRLALRAAWEYPDFEIVHINEINGDAKTAAHLLEFDSVHGRWNKNISSTEQSIDIDGKALTYTSYSSSSDITWANHDIDIMLECSGQFKTSDTLTPYFDHGIKKVIVSAPVKEDSVLNIVYGVNHDLYDHKKNHLITAASCTTNCLAPVVKVVHKKMGIKHGVITTIHDVTNTQTIIDAPHKDLRRARACNVSLIPTTTGSATAITLIYPELKGKLNGLAVRVPLLNSSITDCVFEVERKTSIEEINGHFKEASETYLKDILGYEEKPLVSVDYKDDIRSSIIDALSTMVIDGTQVKILAWYDNEIGYVNRLADMTKMVTSSL